jgi:hypothetical protein
MNAPTNRNSVPAGLARVLKMAEECPPPKLMVEGRRLRVVPQARPRANRTAT